MRPASASTRSQAATSLDTEVPTPMGTTQRSAMTFMKPSLARGRDRSTAPRVFLTFGGPQGHVALPDGRGSAGSVRSVAQYVMRLAARQGNRRHHHIAILRKDDGAHGLGAVQVKGVAAQIDESIVYLPGAVAAVIHDRRWRLAGIVLECAPVAQVLGE